VAQSQDIKLAQRIKNAGADSVVSPQFIGGMRLVSEMVRPTVVSFLDRMLRDMEKNIRIEEVRIEAGSPLSGQQLRDQGIAGSDVLVMAIQDPGSSRFLYVPDAGARLQPGCTLVVLGDADRVARLRVLAGTTGQIE
jgi:voltage-gated potassium channel